MLRLDDMATALLNVHGIARTSAPKANRARTSRRSHARVVVVRAADEKKVRRKERGKNRWNTGRDEVDANVDVKTKGRRWIQWPAQTTEQASRKRGGAFEFRTNFPGMAVGTCLDLSRLWFASESVPCTIAKSPLRDQQ